MGRRLRRAVADRRIGRPTSSIDLRREGAAGDQQRQPAAHRRRRVLTPKGGTDGGGGGADAGAGTMRKDFRVLAFWLGSVTTDAAGRATVDVKLPESLTTYRIMAVAADRASRFGSGDSEIRINKPITLKPTYPRFLAVGDTALFGAVVTASSKTAGTATVTMKSLDPAVLESRPRRPTVAPDCRRRVGRSALRWRRPRDRPRAHPDDGERRRRDRRLRGRHPGRGAGLAGNRGGLRRGHGRRATATRR